MGWVDIDQGESITLTHDIGGDSTDYFVDLQIHSTVNGITNFKLGAERYESGLTFYMEGAYYADLTSSTIRVARALDDDDVDKVRVRIWVIE